MHTWVLASSSFSQTINGAISLFSPSWQQRFSLLTIATAATLRAGFSSSLLSHQRPQIFQSSSFSPLHAEPSFEAAGLPHVLPNRMMPSRSPRLQGREQVPLAFLSESEIRCWKQLLVFDFGTPDEEDDILEDARIRDRLLRAARQNERAVAAVNFLCPHWPPLRSRTSLDREVEAALAADKLTDPDDIHRAIFGLDPSLPWDLFLDDPDSLSLEQRDVMERRRNASLLSVSLDARIQAEQILVGSWDVDDDSYSLLAETWLAAKASHNGSCLEPPQIWELSTVLKEESRRVGARLPRHPQLQWLEGAPSTPPSAAIPDNGTPPSTPFTPLSSSRKTRRGARGKRITPAPAGPAEEQQVTSNVTSGARREPRSS